MRIRTLALLAPAVLALGAQPARSAEPSVPDALYGSEFEARGDFGGWLSELLDAYTAEPESPYGVLLLQKIRGLTGHAEDVGVVASRLTPVFDAGVGDPEVLEVLTDVLADRARAAGDFDRGNAYAGNAGYLRKFASVGPFGWSEDALVHKHYAPESGEVDPTQTYEDSRGVKGWKTLPVVGESAWVRPFDQLRRGGSGVTYSMARVRSSAPGTVALKVHCGTSFKLTVNGREIVSADQRRDRVPDPVWCTARLQDGWNRIVMKLAGRGSFAIKVCDAGTGAILRGLEEGDPLLADAAPAAGEPADALTYKSPLERVIAAAAADDDAARLTAAAQMLSSADRDWEAYEAFEKAAALATALPDVPQANILSSHGRFLADFGPFPDVQRKLRAKPQFLAALEAHRGHVSATVRIARYEDEDDRPDKAVKSVQKLVSENPNASAWMTLARIARNRGWEREAQDAAEAASSLAPNLEEPLTFLAAIDKQYANHESRIARMRQVLAIDAGDGTAINAVIDSLRAQGKQTEAVELLQEMTARWPASLGWRRQLAAVMTELGEEEEALKIFNDLATRVPEEAQYPSEIGHVLELTGNGDGAVEAFEKSLSLAGYQPNLWRRVKRLRGEVEDFGARYEPDVEAIISGLDSTEDMVAKYPKAVAVTVLDHTVTRVRPDGSSESYVHMIYKILNEKGVAKYGDVGNSGELLEIRSILPDGTEMAPTGLRRRSFNMEGLVPGTVIEHRYFATSRPGRDGYDGGQFYFQDFEFRRSPNPVLMSRYVVLVLDDMKVEWTKRNYDEEPDVKKAGGYTATTWQKTDMPIIEWEQSMPGRDEIVPHVNYSPKPKMDDVNWEYLGGADDTRTSPILEEALSRAVTEGMSDTERLHAIHAFVNEEILGDFSMGSDPAAILLEKAGDRAQLFEAMVRASGIPHKQARAMPNRGDGMDLDKATSRSFSRPFLWLEPRDGEPVPYFAGSHHAPFGLVPRAFRRSFAYIASPHGGRIVQLPASGVPVDDTVSFVVHLGADAEATRVSGTLNYRSPNGYGFKRQIEEMSQDDRRKFAERQISQYFESPALEEFEFPEVERKGTPLRVWVSGTMPQYLTQQGDGVVASLGLPKSGMTGRFVHRPERTYDLILNPHDDDIAEVEIHLGDAFEVASLPEDHLSVGDLGVYSLTWRHTGGVVNVRREMHLKPARYTPDQYAEFTAWCKAIDDAEDRKLELRRRK